MAHKISLIDSEKQGRLTGVDKALAIAWLKDQGKTDTDICALYNIGEKQLRRYEKVGTFPKVLKDAVAEESILTSHGLLLMQAYEHNQKKINLPDWVNRIVVEELSVRQLQRELDKTFGKPKKKVRYMEKKGGGFRLYPMRFDPDKTDIATRETMKEKLREALCLLEGWRD